MLRLFYHINPYMFSWFTLVAKLLKTGMNKCIPVNGISLMRFFKATAESGYMLYSICVILYTKLANLPLHIEHFTKQ